MCERINQKLTIKDFYDTDLIELSNSGTWDETELDMVREGDSEPERIDLTLIDHRSDGVNRHTIGLSLDDTKHLIMALVQLVEQEEAILNSLLNPKPIKKKTTRKKGK